MADTVADALVATLEELGVRNIFGLIGDSLNPLADAVRRSSIEWIGVRHEEGAALAAAGQAKLTGRLGVCCGTTGPGSTHLVPGLYEAARDHAPVLALSGGMPRKLRGTDYFQSTTPDLLFRDVALYTETVSTGAQAPAVIHQAIAKAYAGPGVAHLTLPQDVLTEATTHATPSLATLRPHHEIAPPETDIEEAVRRIQDAEKVVFLCGAGCRGNAELLIALSDHLSAPLVHTVRAKDLIAFTDPRWMGGLGMIGTRAAYNAVQHCDLLIMVGTDYPYSEYLPSAGNVIQIDQRAEALGRRTPTSLGIVGSVGPSLRAILNRVSRKTDMTFFNKIARERVRWNNMLDRQAAVTRSAGRLHPQAVARAVSDLSREDAIFVFDTGLNTLWSANWLRQTGRQRIIGSFNNGAVGTALGQGNGIQALDRSKQVIVFIGDGGFNMLMGEFLTATHHGLPVKVVVYNNSALGLISLEAESVGIPAFHEAIRYPNPDYAMLARACGGTGFTVRDPSQLKATLREAFATDGPVIVDAVVADDEIPNLPHVELKRVGNYAIARVKEALLSVTGG
jgi:thiamine pyrophosphate-dependent acetolactate synthase large subunit-like protein